MKKISTFLTICTAAFVLIAMPACQSTKTATAAKTLKFNLEKGRGYDYEMNMSMDQEVMGQKIKMDMDAYYSMNVTDDNGGVKTIASKFDRMKMLMDMGIMKIDIDTEKPIPTSNDENPMNKAFAMINRIFGALKGKTFEMKVNPEGKVMEVKGLNELSNAMIDSMGQELGEEEKMKMRQQMGQMMSDEQMQNQFDRFFHVFPNKEVKVGDTWEKTSTIQESNMPVTYKSNYTVKEIEGDMVTVDEKSTLTSSGAAEMDMKGTIDGTLVIDSRTGLVMSANQDMNMNTTVQGQQLKMHAVTKIKGKAN